MRDRAPNPAHWRLSPVIALLTVLALLSAGVLAVYLSERSYEAQKADEAQVQAQILASTVAAAIFFGDHEAAQGYVNALSVNREVQAVTLYDASGAVFAKYARGGTATLVAPKTSVAARLEGDVLTVAMPVVQDSAQVGTVAIRTSIESVSRRFLRYGVVALLTLMASLVVAILGVAQGALTKTNAELADKASRLEAANRDLEIQMRERAKAEQALRKAQKMEAIGQLTGGVAHDFNNLLTVVIGNLDLMEIKAANANEIRRLSHSAIQAAERGARLVKQLLMFARRQPMSPENVNPNRLLEEFEPLVKRAVGANVELVWQLDPVLDGTRLDRTQFEAAILNLVVNAREAIPGSGRISVTTRNVELGPDDLPDDPDAAPGSYVLVEVSDTGRGIPPDRLSQVFDPFFTTKGVGEGSGLGLSQVYGFVKESGGFVAIRSDVGAGTTVSLYLPHATRMDTSVSAEPTPQSRTQSAFGNATILVVEDEKIVLDMAVESLKLLGYRVLSAENGAQALEIIKSESQIDILFSDVVMPGDINGAQLAATAARVRPDLKVLLTSGYVATSLTETHGLKQGTPILQKPYRTIQLVEQLRAITAAGGAAA